MGCVKKVIPWVIDPIGMGINTLTGGKFPYTPGGVANAVLNPPKRLQPQRSADPEPQPTIQAPRISLIYPTQPPPLQPRPTPRPRTGAPAGADSDKTAGLVSGRRGGSLLA